MRITALILTIVLSTLTFNSAVAQSATGKNAPKLLPVPSQMNLTGGASTQPSLLTSVRLSPGLKMPEVPAMVNLKQSQNTGKGTIQLILAHDSARIPTEGYELEVANNTATVTASSASGIFYGCQTLTQLIQDARDLNSTIPALKIVDKPHVSFRAVHLDLKHHLDSLSYYYKMVDRLAALKINAMIVEFEDKLAYRNATKVGASNAISIEEFRKLSEYAQKRNIEVSPLVQGLGHASFILKHAEYADLRDDTSSDWSFDPLNPKTYDLQFSLYDDALAATPHGKYLHIGGDEVGRLGMSELAKKSGLTPIELQLTWLKKVCDYASEHKRIPIFWDDMLLKLAGLYETTYDPSIPEAEVEKRWKENEHLLNEHLHLFPRNCVYMRWNYDFPTLQGNKNAIEWYNKNNLSVMAATAGQQTWPLLPRASSNFRSIKEFSQMTASGKLVGILLTLWDDASPHFETFWRGIHDYALFTWNSKDIPKDEAHALFRYRYYGPKLASSEYNIQDSLETAAHFWETALINTGHRENYPSNIDTLTLPDHDRPGYWSNANAKKIIAARRQVTRYNALKSKLSQAVSVAKRNTYTLEVLQQINELTVYPARIILTLAKFDAAKSDKEKTEATAGLKQIINSFPQLRQRFERIYGKTRILSNPDDYRMDQNHHHHLANGTRNNDWMFVYEMAINEKIKKYLSNAAAGDYYSPDDFHSTKKYDVHIHIEGDNNILLEQAKKDNFRMLNINGDWGPLSMDQQEAFSLKAEKAYPHQVAWAASFDVKNWKDPQWTSQTLDRLSKAFSKGAIAVKVWKNIGMELRDEDGKFVMIDHPRFDTIIDFIEKNNKTLLTHQGEPKNCWLPLEHMTVKGDRNYFAQHPQYHMYLHPEYPSYQDQIDARDRMVAKHRDARIVSVHLASLEWDVDEIAKRLDRFPNFAVDIAARIEHLQHAATTNWQKVHDFFVKYQDRILYGTDLLESEDSNPSLAKELHDKWINDWKFFVTNDPLTNSDEMKYRGLRLPRSIVDKIYAKNAERWIPGIQAIK